MIKRPLCMAAVLLVCVQAAGVCFIKPPKSQKPSALEQTVQAGAEVTVTGTVSRKEEKPEYCTLYLQDNHVRSLNKSFHESSILVYIETKNQPLIGNKIQVTGQADVFEEARNPGNFDQKSYYQKQGMYVFVWADAMEVVDTRVWHIREWLAALRKSWKSMLVRELGEYYGNTMSAILLGDKGGLDKGLKNLFQKSGIGHILAISGLHMSFLGTGFYKVLRRAGLSFWTAGTAGILFLLAYTAMIGSGVSSLRALVMFIVRMGADISGRDYDLPTSLALAAAAITLWRPLYLLDAGFLLSFGALLGIGAVSPYVEFCIGADLQVKENKPPIGCGGRYTGKIAASLVKAMCPSLAVNLTLLPVLLYFYYEFPPYSILLNLLVIPLMSVLLGAGVVGSVLGIFWGEAGRGVFWICAFVLKIYEKTCQAGMHMPGSRIVAGRPQAGGIIVYYSILFVLCTVVYLIKGYKRKGTRTLKLLQRKKERFLLGGISITVLMLALFTACGQKTRAGELTVTMLDVGQGDGLYLKGPKGRNYLIDGGSSDVSGVGQYRLIPYLKSIGVSSLDYIFVSHGDMDHISGIVELLESQDEEICVRNLVLPPGRVHDESLQKLARTASDNHTRIATMEPGDIIQEGGLELKCLAPVTAYKEEPGNGASMVLEARMGEFEMLFTGDIEGEGERLLEQSGALKEYDILKAAHHGSKNSGAGEFLALTRPKAVWISSGTGNRYGHPHKEALERFGIYTDFVYNTQDTGALTLVTDGKKLRQEAFLK